MIKVDSISKKFKIYKSPGDMLKEIFLFWKSYHTEFWALRDVSFEVPDGRTLGIIGQNGAGKSTLLKILTGIYLPDSGAIRINGKITGLLELGTGFNYEMTGVENIYMNGLLLGMSREEIDGKKEAIIEFTELGDFIFEPIKLYSSGMTMRLAFSIAIHADPQCFVVDEALSVGDAHFQQKCMKKIREFRDSGGSIIYVSHDINSIKMHCDRVLLLDHGAVVKEGDPEEVCNLYYYILARLSERDRQTKVQAEDGSSSYGSFEAKIVNVAVVGEKSRSGIISSGERADISIEMEAFNDRKDITVGITIRDKFGQDIFGTNTYHHDKKITLKKGKKYTCHFITDMNMAPGKYSISVALHTGVSHLEDCLHWKDNCLDFEIAGIHGSYFVGVCRLQPEIYIEEKR